jgi:uncharacterized protein (DUF58 family)
MSAAPALLPPHVLERLGGLEFVARRIVEGFVAGTHRSPYRGAGEEFARHRAYQQGDPVRNIDWRVYARSDRLFVREYREDSSLHCWIVVDCTQSMGYADAHGISKLRYATFIAAALAHIMLKAGDAVGLATCDARAALRVPPRNRRGQLHDMIIELERLAAHGAAAIDTAVDAAGAVLRRRGRVVILSDMLSDDDGAALIAAVGRLRARGSEVAVLRVLTPAEAGSEPLPPADYFDPEVPRRSAVGSGGDSGYRERLDAYYGNIAASLREHGAEYVELLTDEPVEHALSAWLLAR